MLLRIGDLPVAPVPPQLVAEVLYAVGLCLRTDFTLRGEQRSKYLDQDEPYFRNKQINKSTYGLMVTVVLLFLDTFCLEDQLFATVIFPQLH